MFARRYREASITVVEDVTVRLLDRLRAGLDDLAILASAGAGMIWSVFHSGRSACLPFFPKATNSPDDAA
jgi:hypothetical protein